MSSKTMSITACGECQPWRSKSGEYRAICAWPGALPTEAIALQGGRMQFLGARVGKRLEVGIGEIRPEIVGERRRHVLSHRNVAQGAQQTVVGVHHDLHLHLLVLSLFVLTLTAPCDDAEPCAGQSGCGVDARRARRLRCSAAYP